MNQRDNFTEETRRALRDRVGGLCSRPECGRLTVAPNDDDTDRVDVTGRAAHITAARKGGARHDETFSPEQRKSAANGIWLCADCADLVDKNEGKGFSVELLQSWKRSAEERQSAMARLRTQLRRPTWLDKLGTPHYANVPRLLHLAGVDALSAEARTSLEHEKPGNDTRACGGRICPAATVDQSG
jgi:hypothetical protein